MKLIEACVRPELADKVIKALAKLDLHCLSVIDVKAIGKEIKDSSEQFSVEYGASYADRSKIKVFCAEAEADKVAATIKSEAHTGHEGDGFVVKVPIDQFTKI